MKKHIKTLIFASIFIFISCEENLPVIGSVPSTFTKKVLIEEFTGAWCGYCPDGAARLEAIIDSNNGNVIGVSMHSGDEMSVAHTDYLGSVYQNTGYPSGMVDRFAINDIVSINRGWWEGVAVDQLTKITNCGLAIESNISGSKAKIEVHTGFNESLTGDLRLTVYLIEDNVIGDGYGYDQSNYYNQDPNSPFYELGNPIVGYEHNHTLRAILSEPMGDIINSTLIESGVDLITEYSIDISSFNKGKLSIVAFITSIGTDHTKHEILNVQRCEIDGLKDWD